MAAGKWKAVRRGAIYCAPRCGCGCIWEAYKRAKAAGKALAATMGQGWSVRVWENCGWHVEVVKGVCDIHIHQSAIGRPAYTVFFNTTQQVVETGHNPVTALARAAKQVRKNAATMAADWLKVVS